MRVRSAPWPRPEGSLVVDHAETAGGSSRRGDDRDGAAEAHRQERVDELLGVGRRRAERLTDEDRGLQEQHRADAEPERIAPDDQRRRSEGSEREPRGLCLGRPETGCAQAVAGESGDSGCRRE